jgi:TetR/AcrR family transcriptional regulator of autoinduction and epiphytic fitness
VSTHAATAANGSHGQVDGRALRAERTREALARGYLDLVTEGDPRPTAERIAERAGCSPRSVFKHFPDREALFAAASEIQEERIREIVGQPIDPAIPLEQRLDAFVDQRTRILEFIGPVRRAALLIEPFSEVVADRLQLARRLSADQVTHVFRPEIEARTGAAREELAAALVTSAAWPAWSSLRDHQELSLDRARAVMRAMLAAQLKDR